MKSHFFGVRTVRGAEHLAVPGLKPAPVAAVKPKRARSPRKKKPVAVATGPVEAAGEQELFADAAAFTPQDLGAGMHGSELEQADADLVRFFDLAEDEQEQP